MSNMLDKYAERSYSTPLSNSTLLPLLLLSLARQKHTPKTSNTINKEYDFIVVGGGAAGSVVASRLSEIHCANVLLLEAGHAPPLLTEVPALGRYFWNTDVDWKFTTVPQRYAASGLINKQIGWTTGKMLGGSGNLNSMVYVRGNHKDYDDWEKQGAKGWSYRDVFPYFLKLEDNKVIKYLANGYHRMGGPVTVEMPKYYPKLKQAAYDAAFSLGYRFVDSNARIQTGFYDHQANIRDNQRCSSVKAYLVPAENRKNLDILLNAMVTKIMVKNGRATGVEFFSEGRYFQVRSKREVIVSAGLVNTPKLLMLSGIGPREELQKLGIPVIADLPVGKSFHDHAGTNFLFTLNRGILSLDEKLADPLNILQFIINRAGPLASSDGYLITAFLNSLNKFPLIDFPNFELYFAEMPVLFLKNAGMKPEVYKKFVGPYEDKPIFSCSVQQLRPKSRGTVTLKSKNPFDSPVIDPNYLEVSRDLEDLVEGLKVCKNLVNTNAMRHLGATAFETLVPGCEIYAGNDTEYFRCFAKSIVFTFHHGAGTSKMGDPLDPSTVVDPELRVKNIQGLRVVDGSIMPTVVSGNTNIPIIMIAEKASDMIKNSVICLNDNLNFFKTFFQERILIT